jgi:hypothetical protein
MEVCQMSIHPFQRTAHRLTQLLLLLITASIFQLSVAQQSRIELTREMVRVTNSFLSGLSTMQRNSATYEFDDEERLNWHFIPRPRNGVPLKSMNENQIRYARELLQTFFSADGFQKSENVRGLETVLAGIEVNGRFDRDPDLYFITVFGTPSFDGDWALRYEGHHQAFNWTFVGGQGVSSSPQFFGSNPAEVRSGPRQGTRVLSAEEDIARNLVTSLDASQATQAILNLETPRDIYTGAEKEIEPLDDQGIAFSALSSPQKQNLILLIQELVSTQPTVIAQARMATIREQGMDDIKFAWIGSTERGDAHYYRVQGPGFLIEYDNTQNNANHVHLVWRDFTGDFGRDLIRMHYDAVAIEYGPGHQH